MSSGRRWSRCCRCRGAKGRPRVDDRRVINGMLFKARTGVSWRDLPERYGPWKTVSTGSGAGHATAPRPAFPSRHPSGTPLPRDVRHQRTKAAQVAAASASPLRGFGGVARNPVPPVGSAENSADDRVDLPDRRSQQPRALVRLALGLLAVVVTFGLVFDIRLSVAAHAAPTKLRVEVLQHPRGHLPDRRRTEGRIDRAVDVALANVAFELVARCESTSASSRVCTLSAALYAALSVPFTDSVR